MGMVGCSYATEGARNEDCDKGGEKRRIKSYEILDGDGNADGIAGDEMGDAAGGG